MTTKKGIAILGSTGSIGTQALEVIEANPETFDLQVLTANNNADLLDLYFLIQYYSFSSKDYNTNYLYYT